MIIIGDVHGKTYRYQEIVDSCDASIQLGDMGFNGDYEYIKENIDSNQHVFFGGNHDDYDYLYYKDFNHCLQDYGNATHNGFNFFFVRGAHSIDHAHRTQSFFDIGIKTFWEQEELSQEQLMQAINVYAKVKPKIMLTHDAPACLVGNVGKNIEKFGFTRNFRSRTQIALNKMFEIHEPDIWVFGHFHRSYQRKVGKTEFICLNELETIEI